MMKFRKGFSSEIWRRYLSIFVINLCTYAKKGFVTRFRNLILLMFCIMLSSSVLLMILDMGIRVKYINMYMTPLRRSLGRVGRGTKWTVKSAGRVEVNATK